MPKEQERGGGRGARRQSAVGKWWGELDAYDKMMAPFIIGFGFVGLGLGVALWLLIIDLLISRCSS